MRPIALAPDDCVCARNFDIEREARATFNGPGFTAAHSASGWRNARDVRNTATIMGHPSTTPPSCRLTRQYHTDGEQVYELECLGVSLEIRVSSRSLMGGTRSWHVAAQLGKSLDSSVITDFDETKRGALEKVGDLWAEQQAELGLPPIDWPAVATALLAVRGI
jgi:hypothetical protein